MSQYDIGMIWPGTPRRPSPARPAGDRALWLALAAVAAAPLLTTLPPGPTIESGYAAASYAGFVFALLSLRRLRMHNDIRRSPEPGRELPRRLGLAIVCMAYPLGAAGRAGLERLPDLVAEALNRMSERSVPEADASWALIGIALAALCWIAVASRRLRQARREADRNAAELRRKAEELERLRRDAEKLAERTILEERRRIAHEIHDAVGYTLTAAVVQLEAAKQIAARQHGVPWEKLDLLSELVRQGLDDIRGAVKLLGEEGAQALTLESALRELIHHTEIRMGAAVDAEISIAPEAELGRQTEQVLYRALQEGLTNGVRHGKCTRFRFSLHMSAGMLRFRLVSDGEPYGSAVPGYGLSSMIERVKLLGGGVDVRSSADADGHPVGCELSIDLPLVG